MSGLLPCPGCANLRDQVRNLETRVAELERRCIPLCERCSAAGGRALSAGHCANCCMALCVAHLAELACPHNELGAHRERP